MYDLCQLMRYWFFTVCFSWLFLLYLALSLPVITIIHLLHRKALHVQSIVPARHTVQHSLFRCCFLFHCTLRKSMNLLPCRLDAKIDEIDKKLQKYKEQIRTSKSQAAQRAAKQQALRLLKQKKMYENQRDRMYSQQMNLESANFMTEQLKDTADQIAVMKQAQGEIAAQMKKVNIDDVDILQEQMQDLWVRDFHL